MHLLMDFAKPDNRLHENYRNFGGNMNCDPVSLSRLESGETVGNLEKLVLVANALEITYRGRD